MIASTHIAAGLLVGMATAYTTTHRVGRIAIAFTAGVLSHMVLDAIPHGDYGVLAPSVVSRIVLCEIIGMSIIGWLILRRRVIPGAGMALVPGLAGAVLPDAKFIARLVLPPPDADVVRMYGDRFHGLFHAAPMANHALGQATQITTTVVLVLLLTRFPRTR